MPEADLLESLAGRRILVVEDEFLVADEIARALQANGMQVIGAAPSVQRALALIKSAPSLDAAVIDVNLSGELAYPVADALAAQSTPFVFATAYVPARLPNRYRTAPHCPKPVQPPDLMRQLLAALTSPPAPGSVDEDDPEEGARPVWRSGPERRPAANALLAGLDSAALRRLEKRGSRVALAYGRILQSPGKPRGEIYFPLKGVISVSQTLSGGQVVETQMIGREGALGLNVGMDCDMSRDWATVTVGGEALLVSNAAFREILVDEPSLATAVHRYQAEVIDELKQRAACNAAHHLPQRLAGWLLRCRARAESDYFGVTQEHLSQVLCAQRTTISAVARQFRQAGLITYIRGRLKIVDWRKLEQVACACHSEADPVHRLTMLDRRADLVALAEPHVRRAIPGPAT